MPTPIPSHASLSAAHVPAALACARRTRAGISFNADGTLVTPWDPKGSWGLIKSASTGEDDGIMRCVDCLFADFANANHNLRFDWSATPPTFTAVRVGDMATVVGKLKSA